MMALTIGPLVLAGDRLAAILAVAAFLAMSALVAKLVDRRLERWSTHALMGGFVGARLGHVLAHLDSFQAEPWRVLAIWQGGFSPAWGIVAAVAVSAAHIRSPRMGGGAAATLSIAVLVWAAGYRIAAGPKDMPPPSIALEQLDGPPMRLSEQSGKPLVVNLWASWCGPCRREMPLLARMAATRDDAMFLFVNQGEAPERVRAYLEQSGLALPHVLLDQGGAVARHYGTAGLPTTLFIRADGRLAGVQTGEISREVLGDAIERSARE